MLFISTLVCGNGRPIHADGCYQSAILRRDWWKLKSRFTRDASPRTVKEVFASRAQRGSAVKRYPRWQTDVELEILFEEGSY